VAFCGLWSFEGCQLGAGSYRSAFFRLFPWALTTVASGMALWQAGLQHMTALLVSSSGLLLFLLVRRAALLRLALAGLVTFTPFYLLAVKLQFAAWPNYLSYWNAGGLWGTLVLGIPRGEIAWAAMFGAAWPVVIASALDIRECEVERGRVYAQARAAE